jgi:5-methyltetrahydropteroyltriglutamate--homocysteine methyltransferase
MKRSEERILTTHVGSLVRPQELLDVGPTFQEPAIKDPEKFREMLRKTVAEVVKQQAAVGIDIVSDGEFGKTSWSNYILDRISGFEIRRDQKRQVKWLGRDLDRFREVIAIDWPMVVDGMPVEACVGPIKYVNYEALTMNIDNFTDALKAVEVEEAFMTAVAPASTAYDSVDEYYHSEHDFVFAIADALRAEYLAIYKAGLIVQVDDAVLANMYDALVQESPERYHEWADLRVEATNRALEGIPEDRVRYHICFGSWHVPHVSDAPLDELVGHILKVRAGAYSIEAANPRHEHEWRVWEKVKLPPEKILIPGVITHHTGTVEHPRVVADRIIRFANIVGRENVIAGTDCGFAQGAGVQRVHPKVVWAKFETLVDGARLATKELWT